MLLTTDVKTKEDIQALCIEFLKHPEGQADYTEQANRVIKNQDCYRGAVWTAEEDKAYRDKGTPPISINRGRPVVKALVGMYLDNLREPSVIPRKNATESMARVWSETIKHAMDMGDGDVAFCTLFFAGIRDSRSTLWIERQQDGSPGGKLAFSADGFFETTIDPNCDVYNISDPKRGAKYVFRSQWIDREICELTWPDKKGEFANGVVSMAGVTGNIPLYNYLTNHLSTTDSKNYRYPVYIIWWRQPAMGVKIKNDETGESRIVTTKKVKMQKGYSWEKVPTFIMHRSIMVGYTLAEDAVNPFGDDITDYPAFSYVPYWESDAQYGALDDVRDLNKEVCVRRTETLRLLKQVVNVGFKVKGGSDPNKRWLADHGSDNGIVIDESEFGGGVERLQPNMPSSGDLLLGDKADLDIDRASQVNEEMRGQEAGRKETVGVTSMRLNQGIKSQLIILRNFWQTMELAGNFLLRVIRKTDIYTNDEVRMIVSKSNLIDKKTLAEAEAALVDQMDGARLPPPIRPQPPNPQIFQLAPPERHADIYIQVSDGIKAAQLYNQRYPRLRRVWDDVVKEEALNKIIEEMRDDALADYGLKVVVSVATASNKLLNWLKEQELMDRYPGIIPPDIFVEDSEIPRKDEIVARMREMQQQRAAQPQLPAQANPNQGAKAALTKQVAMAG